MRRVRMGLLALALFDKPCATDAGLAKQVGVSDHTVNKYVMLVMALGIPRVAGIRSIGGVPGERFPDWPPLAERIDTLLGERVRRNSVSGGDGCGSRHRLSVTTSSSSRKP